MEGIARRSYGNRSACRSIQRSWASCLRDLRVGHPGVMGAYLRATESDDGNDGHA